MSNTNAAGAMQLDDGGPDGATIAGALISSDAVTSSSATGGIGYSTGAGGAVTQITSITTGVTSNTVCGTITTVASTLVAGADATFTVTSSAVAANDVVTACTKSYGGSADGIPICNVSAVADGSFDINIRNTGAVTLDALIVLNFAVIKSVAA
jgi:hypothetical protein